MSEEQPIVAECEGIKSSIVIGRPKWDDMSLHYPNEEIDTEDLYDEIGGGLSENLKNNRIDWENSCAIRMSRGLNYSGLVLPEAPSKGGTIIGNDKYKYWIRVNDMKSYLAKKLGNPEVDTDGGESAINKFKCKKGIIAFDVTGWNNATGHVTLWDGTDLSYAPGHNTLSLEYHPEYCYFQMEYTEKGKTVKTTKIRLWELI